MRCVVRGIVAGFALTLAIGLVVALWKWEWPFDRTKIAARAVMDVTRIASAAGALIGGIVGGIIQRFRHPQPPE